MSGDKIIRALTRNAHVFWTNAPTRLQFPLVCIIIYYILGKCDYYLLINVDPGNVLMPVVWKLIGNAAHAANTSRESLTINMRSNS